MPFCRRGGRLTFLLLRQKQSKQKKRRPWCLRPSTSLRTTCGAHFSRGLVQTRFAQTSTSPDPPDAPLLGALTRVCKRGSDSDSGIASRYSVATILVAACARSTKARDRKLLSKRRAAWFLGSDRNFAAKHPQGTPEARRIWALTPKTPDSDSASASAPDPIPNAVWQG